MERYKYGRCAHDCLEACQLRWHGGVIKYVRRLIRAPNTLGKPLTFSSSPAQQRLQLALENFHRILTPEEFAKLSNTPPSAESILDMTKEIDRKGKKRRLRRFASHFAPLVDSIQRYSIAVEILISSNPQIAALVWGSIKVVIIVCLPYLIWPYPSTHFTRWPSTLPNSSKSLLKCFGKLEL